MPSRCLAGTFATGDCTHPPYGLHEVFTEPRHCQVRSGLVLCSVAPLGGTTPGGVDPFVACRKAPP